jgi:predicted Zn-ribbon and HTH transcriptional regulator
VRLLNILKKKCLTKVILYDNLNTMEVINMDKEKCNLCGYTWVIRTEKPAACPKCKRYDYKKSAAPKLVNDSKST